MRIKITNKDVKWSYLGVFLTNGINILLLPFIISFLTSMEMGLWYTFTAIYGLVVILDFGFSTTLARNITFVWEGANSILSDGYNYDQNSKGSTNYILFVKLFKTTKIIYYTLGIIIFITLSTIGTYYIYQISKSEIDIIVVMLSWLFYGLAIFLNMTYSFWNPILKGIGAIKENQKVIVISKLAQLFLTIISLMIGLGLVGVSLAYFISVLINRLLANKAFFSYEKNRERIKPLLNNKISKKEYIELLKLLIPNTYKQGLISLSNYINLRLITILSSGFLGLGITASLGLVLQITTLISVVANTFFNTYLPQFSSLKMKGKYEDLKRIFLKAVIINNVTMILMYSILLVVGDFILDLLNSDTQLLTMPYLLVIMFYTFLYNNHLVFATFISSGNVYPYYKAFIFSAAVVILSQIVLMYSNERSLWDLILPIFLVQLAYNNWRWPLYVLREMKTQK